MNHVTVIGAGLAGSECAWQLAQRGVAVTLREMKPEKKTPAHVTDYFAELCCSNSLRGAGLENAVGLLKEELRRLNSLIMRCADATAVPAGGALAVWAGTLAVNPSLYRNLAFDPQTSFVPIALVADVPNILVVNNQFPAKTFAEFIDYAKKNPDAVNYGSTGHGSSMHLAAELVMMETSSKMVHIPYSAPGLATTNLLANDIQAMFQLVPGVVGQIRGGKLRALAIMSPSRSSALPDVPTTTELGFPKLLSSTWFALLAPKGTPAAILDQLNTVVNEILSDPEVKKKLADMGSAPLGGTRQALADHLAAETTKWRQIVRAAKIQVQ